MENNNSAQTKGGVDSAEIHSRINTTPTRLHRELLPTPQAPPPVNNSEQSSVPLQVLAPTQVQSNAIPPTSPAPVAPTISPPASLVTPMVEEKPKTISSLHKAEKPVSIIVIILVILLSIFNVAYLFRVRSVRHTNYLKFYNSQPSVIQANAQRSFGPELVSRTDKKLDLTNLVSNKLSPFTQNIKFGLNQQVNFSNGMSFMVTNYQQNWQSQDGYTPLSPGDYFIELDYVVGNRSPNSQDIILPNINATINGVSQSVIAYPYDPKINGLPNIANIDTSTQLQPQQQIEGGIVVEVPKDTLPPLTFTMQGISYNDLQVNMTAVLTL